MPSITRADAQPLMKVPNQKLKPKKVRKGKKKDGAKKR